METYSYENVRNAYKAIIEIGDQCVRHPIFSKWFAQKQHEKNLDSLDEMSRELYVELMNDPHIHYF